MKDEDRAKEQHQSGVNNKKRFPVWIIWTSAAALFIVLGIGSYFFIPYKRGACRRDMEKVTLGASKSFLSIPVFIAQEQGYFEKEGIDLTLKEYASGKLAARSMLDGEIDIATVADMPVVFNSFVRDDFCIVATFTASYSFIKIIARKDKGIKTAADLIGKKVGVNPGTSSHFYLGVFLIHNQISISEIEMVNIKTVDLPAALKSNEVDAISVWAPYNQSARQLLQSNAIELPASDIYRATFNFAVLKSYARDNPETIKKFLKAIDRAAIFIQNKKKESQVTITERFELGTEIVDTNWDNYIFKVSLDQSLLITWDDIARWAINNKLTDKKTIPNYFDYIYLDALDAVKPESITIIR